MRILLIEKITWLFLKWIQIVRVYCLCTLLKIFKYYEEEDLIVENARFRFQWKLLDNAFGLGARILLEDTGEVLTKIRLMVVNFSNAIHILRVRLNF